jgi:archaellum biogenesis ATPase FlaH
MPYNLDDFAQIPSTKEIVTDKLDLNALPDIESVKTLARWTPDMDELFNRSFEWFTAGPDKQDRSAALARLAYSGAEMGWQDEQVAAMLYDADDRWQKYTSRRKQTRDNIILNLINRAREKHGYVQLGDIDLSKFTKAIDHDNPLSVAEPLIWGFQDFIEADFPINWVLDQMIAAGGIGLVTGYPGTGKTQLCLQMAANLALGQKFLHWPHVGANKKVLFLSLEMGKAPLNLFMTTIGESYEDKVTLNKNFKVAPFGVPLPLDTEPGQRFMDNLLEEYMPDVVFIDSLQKVISKEMTDELAVKALFSYLANTREKYGTAMVIVHHNRKKSNDAQKKDIELNDVYGSYLIGGEVDFTLSIKKTDTPNVLTIEMLKNRLGKEQPPFEVARDGNLHFDQAMDLELTNFKNREEEDAELSGE